MGVLGTIEPAAGAAAGRKEWVALISTHPALAQVQPRQGINPFTKQPTPYEASPDSARVLVEGAEVGQISWAQDRSKVLVVTSSANAQAQVANVAADVAARLGWKYAPSSAA